MKMIIVGCGRNGSGLARDLSMLGHSVVVIDRDAEAFSRLGSAFRGQTVIGHAIDREVLASAGIERADGFAAVTASDETNLVAARIARNVFRVPRVVARVYDPSQAEIYRRLGVQTISPPRLGAQRMIELLCYANVEPIQSLGNGDVDMMNVDLPATLADHPVRDLMMAGELLVVAVSRDNQTILADPSLTLQAGDVLHMAVARNAHKQLNALLNGH
jgi:trk system potassium uptake protein TrkA